MQKPPPFWRFPTYAALLAEPYVEATELENGNISLSLKVLEITLTKILQKVSQHGVQSVGLDLFTQDHLRLLASGLQLIHDCGEVAEAAISAEKPEEVMTLLQQFVEKIEKLEIGKQMLIPGGWNHLQSVGSVLFIVERTAETYTVVLCNSGQGLEYHPSSGSDTAATPPKIKYRTSLRFEGIAPRKISDIAFWSTMFSLWVKKEPSEYHRHEVIYDVLLPWLLEGK